MNKFVYQSLDSTQNQAKRLIDEAQITNPIYIVAGEQTAGRGQYGKSWASPAGAGIYMSVVAFKADGSMINEEFVATYTTQVAEQLIACLHEIYQADYYIKPINDVYYNGAKLAGILVELYKGHIIIGLGINLRNVPRTLKESLVDQPKAPPISLEEIFPAEIFKNFDEKNFVANLASKLTST